MWIYRLTNIFYLRCCPFPALYFWCPYRGLVDCMCVGLFLGFLFCSIDLFVWYFGWCDPASVTTAMEYSLKSESVMPPALFFFLKVALDIWGLLWFYVIQQPHFWVLIQRNLNQNLKEMFIAALFTISKEWKQPKCPLLDKKTLVYMYSGILSNLTKGGKSAICDNVNGPGEHCVCAQSCPTLCDPMDYSPPASSVGFSRQEYWSESLLLLQRIFPTQIVNSHLMHHLHWLVDSLPRGPPGKPRKH